MVSIAVARDDVKARAKPLGASWSLRLLLLAAAGLFAARVALAIHTDLAEDEAYYWLWSRHLAPGYYDHPPMIALWIRAGTEIFGDTAFGIRFLPLLSVVGGSWLLYAAGLALFRDRHAAVLAAVWLNVTLFCNAAAILATPDTPLAFFAGLMFFALAKLIETGRGAWWYAIGAALGAAAMSKYTAALLAPSLLLWMLATPSGRKWFARPEPWLGALIALAVMAPMIIWNYQHDWVSFAKQLDHGIKDRPANALKSIVEFIGGQAGLATPLIFGFCVLGCVFSLGRGVRQRDSRWLLLGLMSAPILLFFLIHAGSEKIQPNWPGFLYPVAILGGVQGFFALSAERQVPAWLRAAFTSAPWLGLAFSAAAFLQLGTGMLPIPAKKDPTLRLKGWQKLGAEAARVQREAGALVILTENYALTGELAFATRQPETVLQIDERIRYASFRAPDETGLWNAPALLVVRHGAGIGKAASFFDHAQFVRTLEREPNKDYDIHILSGYRGGMFGAGR